MTLEHKTVMEIADAVADALLGTTDMIESAVDSVLENPKFKSLEIPSYDVLMFNTAFTDRVDERVQCCTTCSWWVEVSEMGNDEQCNECADEYGTNENSEEEE